MRELPKESGVVEIPILPKGKELTVTILETWGDKNYVGLTGIEVFDQNGKAVKV